MKKILNLSLLMLALFAFTSAAFGQKKLKEGFVKFELSTDGAEDSPEMAMLGGSTLDFYFTSEKQKMDMSMMGGMMRVQTIVPIGNPKDAAILMDMLGQKIQLIGLSEEDLSGNYNMMNIDGIKDVIYDENDKKTILGYPCYKASVKMDNNMNMTYYITEKIQPPTGMKGKAQAVGLKGYPLEMIIDTGEGMKMVFKASEVSKDLPKDIFLVPDGYQKMTMEEFTEMTGGLMGK
ncbi:MAG: DUF4412 domain-containing protein [Bacteroidetes bacterium]|nr:DUF4412 domain-containing protein [Bacteroidota bacterium]